MKMGIQTQQIQDRGIRVAAGALLYRRVSKGIGSETKLEFLLLRNARRSEWGFPKGHIDAKDSDILATAAREIKEETGLSDVLLHTGFRERISYPLKSGETKVVTYFLGRVEGGEVVLSDEHDAYKWAENVQAVAHLVHPALRSVLSSVMRFLGQNEVNSDLL